MDDLTKRAAAVFRAIGDENRIQILNILKDGEKNAHNLLTSLQITQPTLSHHMKILCETGLVLGKRVGRWTYYSLVTEGLQIARAYMGQLDSAGEGA